MVVGALDLSRIFLRNRLIREQTPRERYTDKYCWWFLEAEPIRAAVRNHERAPFCPVPSETYSSALWPPILILPREKRLVAKHDTDKPVKLICSTWDRSAAAFYRSYRYIFWFHIQKILTSVTASYINIKRCGTIPMRITNYWFVNI